MSGGVEVLAACGLVRAIGPRPYALWGAMEASKKRRTDPFPLFADAMNAYVPRSAALFQPTRIVLAKGSVATGTPRPLVDAICELYHSAEVLEMPDVPHNRVDVGPGDELAVHRRGKTTLVLAEHASAVRFSQEEHNTCPNYWHFSPYGFCPYDCAYCYLAGTQGVRFSPTVKIFLNLPEMLEQIDRIARRAARPTAFYLGKLQDGLALDPLTGYSRTMVPFFAGHPHARLIVLTKAADVENLLDLDHARHTTLSWSLNPPEICAEFERGTPALQDRIKAMRTCAEAGYPIRAVIMPVIPAPGWQETYAAFISDLLAQVPLERMTLGGVCSYPAARRLMEAKLGADNAISCALGKAGGRSLDGRSRYPASRRIELYGYLIDVIRKLEPELPTSLCLEELDVFRALSLVRAIGRYNCVL